jgi:hypothetical protein
MIVLCTYSLQASRTVDMLDVARAHQCSIALRNGNWEFLETPELKQAKQEIRRLMVHWMSCRAWTESRALLTTINAPIVAHAINELALQKEAEI